ncbi:PTS system glucose-specific EIIA component [Buchnera aphidicola (Cinara pseudotaxifoliae)]|uniref:PTS system glucose-specific EIIA component n=1 Tax=Buchnera aphidicola (Cinara pseudotaxifoliae) TaxID=655384 RepID=A0A451DG54_9GAMM|nr:PTS glucose transporter subunit IIA [Buchnera aphidicola]VFP85608.1 PTS system glucose-specific EIIA component [Buchnera aphidicola (Cinara pseudotaxifoliae)]
MNIKKQCILSPITGIVQNIYNIKNTVISQKKIIIHSNKKIIVSPCNGKIKNYSSKKIEFLIQSEYGAKILIKNKLFKKKHQKYTVVSMNKEFVSTCTGKILFVIHNANSNNEPIHILTTIKITCKKEISDPKKKLYKTQAGLTILAYI